MGSIGIKAIIYFEVATTLALFIGLGAVNLVRPGAGIRIEQAAVTGETSQDGSHIGHPGTSFPSSIIDYGPRQSFADRRLFINFGAPARV